MLKDQPVNILQAALAAVESSLEQRPTKAAVVNALADKGLCSYGSSGIEKSFLKVLKDKGITLTPRFAKLMGEASPLPTAGQRAEGTPVSSPPKNVPAPKNVLLNLRAVEMVNFAEGGATALVDGGTISLGVVDVSVLRSNSNLLEFRV